MTPDEPTMIQFSDVKATLRRRRWHFLVLAAAVIYSVNAFAALRAPDNPQYHAEALVVATALEIRVDSFPRTAVAIFNGGTVARLAAERAGTGITAEELVPAIVTVEPVENTGVVEVDAVHPDPELAALYANVTGQALAEELNRVGPGLGTFALQIDAAVPTEPMPRPLLPIIGLSIVASILVTAGVGTLLTFVQQARSQRPQISGASETVDAGETVDVHPGERNDNGTGSDPWMADEEPGDLHLDPAMVAEPMQSDHEPQTEGVNHSDQRARDGGFITEPEVQAEEGGHLGTVEDSPSATSYPASEPLVVYLDEASAELQGSEVGSDIGEIAEKIKGVGPVFKDRLASVGIRLVEQLADSDPDHLSDAIDVRRPVVEDWIDQAKEIMQTSGRDAEEA